MKPMTQDVRNPLFTLGILTALIGLLSAGCSSSDPEAGVVRSVAIAGTVTDDRTTEKAEDTSGTVTVAEIPIQFQGLWDSNVEGCSGHHGEGRLSLEPDSIAFYESNGPVTEVAIHGESKITVHAELFSEGTTFVSVKTFELSDDRSSLTDTDTGFVRYRCPDGTAASKSESARGDVVVRTAKAGEDTFAVEENSPVVTAAQAGEDAFAVKDRPQTTVARTVTPLDIDIEIGMPYSEARERILQQGWIPQEGPEPSPYGGERVLYEAGFTEVDSCSGTGLGSCLFYFSHPELTGPNEEKILRVRTNGGTSRPEIAEWSTAYYSGTPPTTAVVAEIPVPFQGTWDFREGGCSMGYGEGRLSLEPDYVKYYESSGPVTEVVTQGDSRITIYAELFGEGSYYTGITTFELSEDGLSLTNVTTDNPLVWSRCSDN